MYYCRITEEWFSIFFPSKTLVSHSACLLTTSILNPFLLGFSFHGEIRFPDPGATLLLSSFLSLSPFFLLHSSLFSCIITLKKKQLWKEKKKKKRIIWFSLPWRELNTPKEKFWYILCTHLHAAGEVNISIIAHFRTRYPVPRYNNCQESMRNKEFSWILAHNLTSINNSTVVHKLRNGLLPDISLAPRFGHVLFMLPLTK